MSQLFDRHCHLTIRRPVIHLLLFLLAIAPAVLAQNRPAPPENVDHRAVDVWSDGTRMSGDLFYPKDLSADHPIPGIVMSHGWGGVRSHLNAAYAPFFAAEGYVVLTIDYRGWGDSDPRLVLKQEMPALDENGEATVKVQAIRELVDPFDEAEDIESAIDFLVGEPGVDPERIGLWGSSFSGGLVVWVAAHDQRVKAIVSQVGAQDFASGLDDPMPQFAEFMAKTIPEGRAGIAQRRILRARGELPPVPQGVNQFPGLRGTPFLDRMVSFSPRAVADQVRAAALIIDAGEEELFDIDQNGKAVYEIIKQHAPAKYYVFEGVTHYDIYSKKRPEALQMEIDWFNEQLGGGGEMEGTGGE